MKMHGLGNDFVVIDRRAAPLEVTPDFARILGDRHRGIGFDQLATIDTCPDTDARLTFWNRDGSLSAACGNATRCIARLLMEDGRQSLVLRTERGDLAARDAGDGLTAVNMGPPVLDWQGIPLLHDCDTLHLPMDGDPVATGMGNPHCTFFMDDIDAVDLTSFGHTHEYHPLFPQRTNVQLAQLVGRDHLRVRVYERGAGPTLASGSSSCAVAVAAARRGLTGRAVRVDLTGGTLDIDWRDDGVWMTGPTAHVADGVLRADWLASVL
ncbi:diaminopimelate epimerase [Maribius pontilimi]|uniref:Diaminopimelate epimerase n=1 Tax=Palleronia pontilimi TaxID=1964209 RepID=A0A934MHH0_9RHOB|nr:diaminopimelate epimerase [Palleronia pontilimi]MBJ3763309.1 diaminopimelate epimerase [Palleronia pontilimi]